MFKHILPNSLGTIITSCALVIPGVINSETSMTYLGIINLQETFGTSIGVLMSQGQTAMTSAPHAMIFPSIFISLLLISFNLFGNGLRDAFNPSMRGVDD
jgi:oligopeptide transport system permease protein